MKDLVKIRIKNFRIMKTKKIILLSGVVIAFYIQAIGQITFTPQYMGRGEYRHGYQSLADTNQNSASFVSQRARLTGEYKTDKYKIVLGVQDIRTWGSVANLAIDSKGLLSISEAYAELTPNKKIAARFGRQILSYDDDRIIGSLDWSMQSRRHDLALFKYTDSTLSIHVGAAYNQNNEQTKTTGYTVAGNYKTFQYLWANKLINKTNLSFLFLNNGYQYGKTNTNGTKDSMTVFSQTAGLRGTYKGEKLSGLIYGYYQFGKDAANKDLNAYCASAEVSYAITKDFSATIGAEILSGTSQTDTANKTNNSFNPFYGTNHRYNGYMDYFYVGNHINSVGLIDGYFKLNYSYKSLMLGLNTHLFNAAANIMDKNVTTSITSLPSILGTELDFTMSYKLTDEVAFQGGYSQIFGTSSMVMLKGGSSSETNNWAYVMLIIRPGKIKWPKTGLKT